jgi:hypothetical protein
MAYRDFSLERVKKEFQLSERQCALFVDPPSLAPSAWLLETLKTSLKLARSSSSEKARSEFIVVPLLLEMERRNQETFAIFSGERLDVDESRGLKGECDFMLSKGPITSTIQAPIFSIVEAKRNDIKEGLGQCIAQMLGAQLFNQAANNEIAVIYGCVTTGEDWQFLRLQERTVEMDENRYYINELGKLLGIFQTILDRFKTHLHLSAVNG